MVNPGSFKGMRKEFLLNEKSAYARAVKERYSADALASIQRRYFKRFPVDLPHDQDPTADFLANINESMPDPEPQAPDPNTLGAEEYLAAMKVLEERQKLIIYRKAQIKRWLAYQYTKDHDLDPKESGSLNPYQILIHKLTGTDVITTKTRRIAKLAGTRHQDLAALQDKIARQMFEKLSKEEQDYWEAQAKEDHQELMKKWEHDTTHPPSTEPTDRQRCIQGLAGFVKPILDLICEATGWKATLIAGGPEPAHEGRLNVISVHSGTTLGNIKMNFGKCEHARYKKNIIPTFGSFLQLCYTPEECKSRALKREDGFDPMVTMETTEDKGVFIDSFESVSVNSSHRSPMPASLPSQVHPVAPSPSSATSKPVPISAKSISSPKFVQTKGLVDNGSSLQQTQSAPSPTLHNRSSSVCLSPPLSPRSPPHSMAPESSSIPHQQPMSRSPSPLPAIAPLDGNLTTLNLSGRSPSPLPTVAPLTPSNGQTPLLSRNPLLSPTVAPLNDPTAPNSSKQSLSLLPTIAPLTPNCQTPLLSPNPSLPPTMPLIDSPPSVQTLSLSQSLSPNPSLSPTIPIIDDPPSNVRTPSFSQGSRKRKLDAEPTPSVRTRKRQHETPSQSASLSVPSSHLIPSPPRSTNSTPSVKSNSATISTSNKRAAEIPLWFETAVSSLKLEENRLGREWSKLVGLWCTFKQMNSYEEITRLKAQYRPVVLKDWIQCARPGLSSWKPAIGNPAKYQEEFLRWYHILQPTWRLARDGKIIAGLDSDWESLNRPGLNGILTVMVGLLYWGLVLKTKETRKWKETVLDFTFVLQKLTDNSS